MFCTGLFLQKGARKNQGGFFPYILAQNTLTAAQPGSQGVTKLAKSCWKESGREGPERGAGGAACRPAAL